jgi:hypothetical protein
MTDPSAPLEAIVVTAPACHLCEDALDVLGDAAPDVVVRAVDIRSDEGRALAERHHPALTPLVLLDGEPFSVGRLPRGKLRRLLASRV